MTVLAKTREPKLTPKQQRFVQEYVIDCNGTQAAIRAGYSRKTAQEISSENLSKPLIRDAVNLLMERMADHCGLTHHLIVSRLKGIVDLDPRKMMDEEGDLKSLADLDDDTAKSLAGVECIEHILNGGEGDTPVLTRTKKFKFPDRVAALRLAMQHRGMLIERSEVDVKQVTKTYVEIRVADIGTRSSQPAIQALPGSRRS